MKRRFPSLSSVARVGAAVLFGSAFVYWSYMASSVDRISAKRHNSDNDVLVVTVGRLGAESVYAENDLTGGQSPIKSSTAEILELHSAPESAVADALNAGAVAVTGREVQQREPPQLLPEKLNTYVEVTDSCGPYFNDACVNIRSGPGTEHPVVTKLRKGAVLKVSELVHGEEHDWYEITFDEWLRYPERVTGTWYISTEFVRPFDAVGMRILSDETVDTEKRIVVDRSDQMLYAYDGEELFMEEPISTGLELTPTPRGTFTVFKMTPTRYMQGPIPGISQKYYDLPGVPWDLYFTEDGAAIHGAYWHDKFGVQWSSGCVNLPPEKARELYEWAELGMEVIVRD